MKSTGAIRLDPYVLDVLMPDLVGHDRRPSAFLVYLLLWRHSKGRGRTTVSLSLATIAAECGLSRAAVQGALRHLERRGLLHVARDGPTAVPRYAIGQPWRR